MSRTYTNPVFGEPFPDPFVLRTAEGYYAYATDVTPERDRAIVALRSDDFVTWEAIDRVLERPRLAPSESDVFWAPEVVALDGRLHMYYSTGKGDAHHRIRVASADTPAGPFRDHDVVLTTDQPFAIDPHPFVDADGTPYLYYARDFLDGERVGTALVVDRLDGVSRLAGTPTTVLRASADWQIYRRGRTMYGAVYDWHTLEGPFVVRRGGRYWCFYSGGAWTGAGYGVSYAVADSPLGPFVEPEPGRPAVLRSCPGELEGPGHCSIVVGPDGADYIVYHAWDPERTARRMCVDRLWWRPEGPRVDGPTLRPQPVPRPG